jgi:hypothetical protein
MRSSFGVDNRSTHSRAFIAAVNFVPDVFADALVFVFAGRRLCDRRAGSFPNIAVAGPLDA